MLDRFIHFENIIVLILEEAKISSNNNPNKYNIEDFTITKEE